MYRVDCLNNRIVRKYVFSKLSHKGCQLRYLDKRRVFQDVEMPEVEIMELCMSEEIERQQDTGDTRYSSSSRSSTYIPS